MAEGTIRKKAELQEYINKGLWQDLTWAEVWDGNAEEYPDKEAIVDERRRLTWHQAKQAADGIALCFLELGLKKDDVIVTQLSNMVEEMLVRIACEKAGLIALPVLRQWKENELKHACEFTDAVGVVIPMWEGDPKHYNMVQEIHPDLPKLKHIFATGGDLPEGCISIDMLVDEQVEHQYSIEDLIDRMMPCTEVAFLSHTTGSTGFPKFAEWPAVLSMARSRDTMIKLGITSESVVAAFAPGAGGLNNPVWNSGSLAAAKLVLLGKWSPEKALELIQKERITYFAAVPTMIMQMIEHPDFDKYDLSSLQCVMVGGAAVLPKLLMDMEEKISATVLQGYGSRDIGMTTCPSVSDPPEIRWFTAGKPNSWDEVMIVNEEDEELARGEVGEIVVKAVTGSAGYFRNAEASTAFHDGLFHIGDLGRFDENGNLVIMGRKKNIIIRGGQNIYPYEIESFLDTHPKVSKSTVVKMPDQLFGEKVCAYVVPKAGEEFTFDEMKSFLIEKKIASYKLPERLEILSEIPMVGGGTKVDLKGLEEDIARKLRSEGKI